MYIIECTIEENKNVVESLIEEISKLIPTEIKFMLTKPKVRKEMLEKYGEKAFLLPKELKFPVVDPKTGEFHCGLIYAAYLRANQWKKKHPKKYSEVEKKAIELFNKVNCASKIGVKINESDEILSIEEVVSLLSI